MEINFDEVNPSDEISFRTKNSRYRFSVVNPEERRGFLSGGSLGDRQRDAVLIASLEGDEADDSHASSVLKTGSRALFYLTAKNGFERLITSVIVQVSRLNPSESKRHAA